MALQDIADRLIAYTICQIGQRPGNPVITPVPVLLGQTNDQLLDLARDPRPAWAATSFRAIELVGDQLAIPGQNGVGLSHSCDLGESRAAEPMPDFTKRGALGVRERALTMRFSAVKYSFRASSSWSTVPVT